MIVPDLPGKTYGQTEKLADHAAITVDPDAASRRREDAERNRARVTLRRDPSGAASLAGYDLPTDETLAAHANVPRSTKTRPHSPASGWTSSAPWPTSI